MSVNLKKLKTMIDRTLEKETPESLNKFFNKEQSAPITTLLEHEPLAALCFAGAIKSLYHDLVLVNDDYISELFSCDIPIHEIRNCLERICEKLHPFDTSEEMKEICTLHAFKTLVEYHNLPPSTLKDPDGNCKKEYLEYFNCFYHTMRGTLLRLNRMPRKEIKDEINSRLMEIASELGDYLLMKEHNCLLEDLIKPEEYVYEEGEHETDYLNEDIQDEFWGYYEELMNKLCIILGFDHDEEDGVRK